MSSKSTKLPRRDCLVGLLIVFIAVSFLQCYDNMGHAIATQEGLSIEYDEDVCCDVCQSVRSGYLMLSVHGFLFH